MILLDPLAPRDGGQLHAVRSLKPPQSGPVTSVFTLTRTHGPMRTYSALCFALALTGCAGGLQGDLSTTIHDATQLGAAVMGCIETYSEVIIAETTSPIDRAAAFLATAVCITDKVQSFVSAHPEHKDDVEVVKAVETAKKLRAIAGAAQLRAVVGAAQAPAPAPEANPYKPAK